MFKIVKDFAGRLVDDSEHYGKVSIPKALR